MSIKKTLSKLYKHYSKKSYVNKYTIVIALFAVWLTFFDKYSIGTQFELTNTVEELENQKLDYQAQLEAALLERKTINSNIEKYGREKYLFHKEGEEIILIK